MMNGGKRVVIGIAGATCGGKTTVANLLKKVFSPCSFVLHQDDYYHPERDHSRVIVDGMNFANWEMPAAFDNKRLLRDIARPHVVPLEEACRRRRRVPELRIRSSRHTDLLKQFEDIVEKYASQSSGSWDFDEDLLIGDLKDLFGRDHLLLPFAVVVVVEGIVVLNEQEIFSTCNKKFFFTLDFETCRRRRSMRRYEPPDPPGYFEKVAWPCYLSNLKNLKEMDQGNEIMYLDGARPILHNFVAVCSHLLQFA